jgi:hypothetical protein
MRRRDRKRAPDPQPPLRREERLVRKNGVIQAEEDRHLQEQRGATRERIGTRLFVERHRRLVELLAIALVARLQGLELRRDLLGLLHRLELHRVQRPEDTLDDRGKDDQAPSIVMDDAEDMLEHPVQAGDHRVEDDVCREQRRERERQDGVSLSNGPRAQIICPRGLQVALLGDEVHATGVPRIATKDAPDGEGYTPHDSVFQHGLLRVLRTRRIESATRPKKRRNRPLIDDDHGRDEPAHGAHPGFRAPRAMATSAARRS